MSENAPSSLEIRHSRQWLGFHELVSAAPARGLPQDRGAQHCRACSDRKQGACWPVFDTKQPRLRHHHAARCPTMLRPPILRQFHRRCRFHGEQRRSSVPCWRLHRERPNHAPSDVTGRFRLHQPGIPCASLCRATRQHAPLRAVGQPGQPRPDLDHGHCRGQPRLHGLGHALRH